ncbi:NAD(P)-dependent alcohol dehydrogenase [Aspergillus stella-maris]|uniref:NAD(P)-dependent alcohol dehydrogenase n=1 Tax=Aspergillus stella-maris TaxID=1810926 RepID=UPI003CCCABB9
MSKPQIMAAWLYSSTFPTLLHNLHHTKLARAPPPPSSPSQFLIRVLSTSLNPADYKVPEQSTILGKTLICTLPASPGLDFAGEIVAVHEDYDKDEFHVRQLVFGCLARPREFGTTGEYIIAEENDLAPLPEGVEIDDAACVGVAMRTAYQSLKNYIKPDTDPNQPAKKVFINGGSGGCGVFAIQFAKMMGFHITTTCSTRNIELVQSLGADEVLDYIKTDVTIALKSKGLVFDHVIDHIGLPQNLYSESHHFLKPGCTWVQVGSGSILTAVWRLLTPRWLGGGRRWFSALMLQNSKADLVAVGEMLREGKVRVVVDSVHDFRGVKGAYEVLVSGRARGKIIVRVAEWGGEGEGEGRI